MAQAALPPSGDLIVGLVSRLPLPSDPAGGPVDDLVGSATLTAAQRVGRHDQLCGESDTTRRRNLRWLRPAADLSVSVLAVAFATRGGTTVHPVVLLVVALVWLLLLARNGWFTRRPLGEAVSSRSSRAVRAGAALGVACWLTYIVVGDVAAPQLLAPVVAALILALLVTGLVTLPGEATTRIVVAGHPEDVRLAIEEFSTSPQVVVVAVCVSAEPDLPLGSLPVHVGVSHAADLAEQSGSDALLVLPGPDLTHPTLRRLQWRADGTGLPLYIGTGLLDVAPVRVSVVQGAGLGVMQVRPVPRRGPARLTKGVLDRLVAAAAVLFLAPVLLAVAVLIRRDSPGPAIFRQQRVGRDGRCFTMYKFRTMSTSAEVERVGLVEQNECDDVLFKMRNDPRITHLGGFLRRYSVDELPQLLNVLTGDMSLVGPRPALPQELDRYDDDPRRRLVVKPGLTGLWQVSGRSDLTWAQSVRLDVRYVDNWSLGLDFKILWRTLGAVLSQRGAY